MKAPPAGPGAEATATAATVSVVVLNYNGGDDTLVCLRHLEELDWPAERLEAVVVDNGSTDGSAEAIEAHARDSRIAVRLRRMGRNTGFAGGCNAGAAVAKGQYLAFLNNDARPDPAWLSAAVPVLASRSDVGCVASKVLSWEGDRVDFVGGGVTFYGFGYRDDFGQPYAVGTKEAAEAEVLFATGSAMVVPAEVFAEAGGFDPRFFAFFEDVDFGWRLWLLGWRVLYVPASVVYHRHHGTMRRFGSWREDYLLERNALFAILKNLDDERLAKALPAALLLAVRRGVLKGEADPGALDLARSAPVDEPRQITLNREAVAPLFALDAVVWALPSLLETRADLQARRRRSDAEILRLVRHPLLPTTGAPQFTEPMQRLVEFLGIDRAFGMRHRIAVVTGDPLHERMSGPGIRALEMAKVLSREHDVRLATTGEASIQGAGFSVESAGRAELRELERWCDVLVFQGFLLHSHPFLVESPKVLVADVYDPFHLEHLELSRELHAERRVAEATATLGVLNDQLRRADFLVCAGGKQRDFWLGQLTGLGRVNPLTYDADPTLESLLATVPFGLPSEPPQRTRRALKGVVPGIGPDDKVVLWGGGIYSWFDPATVVRAVAVARERRPDLRLYFMGSRHPNPLVPAMRVVTETVELARRLGLLDREVFFNDDWVAYGDRQNYLLDADVGVSAHLHHLETAYSFRTRLLDYVWAGLPIVTTGGDTLGDLVERDGLGLVVPPGDVEAMADALVRLLDDADLAARTRANLAAAARQLTWEQALAPLVEFCRAPQRAPDLAAPGAAALLQPPRVVPPAPTLGRLAQVAVARARADGVVPASAAVARYVRRRLFPAPG